jgi:xanthine dehydrogenase accessory factor
MKHWLETRQVLDAVAACVSRGHRGALATVVRVRGSAYRHEGAKLFVAEDGSHVGNVSGGCLEMDVRELAAQVIASGVAERRAWCGSSDPVEAWDLGVGCEGEVEIVIERVNNARAAERTLLDQDDAFVIVTRLDRADHRLVLGAGVSSGSLGDAVLDDAARSARAAWVRDGRSVVLDLHAVECFVDVLLPPPRLVVCSAGDDAAVLANLAADVGFSVSVVDRRPGLLEPARFRPSVRLIEAGANTLASRVTLDARSYAVVMTHHFADDAAYLDVLLDTDVSYIGMLGPRQRTERMLAARPPGGSPDVSRVFGPVGLDIGTDGAEQVALSVIAEVLAVRSGRGAVSLRERRAPIHAEVMV